MSAGKHDREQRLMALFTATPQLGEVEQTCHYIRTHRERRDQCALDSREWHIERIKMDWWLAKLLLAMGCPS